MHQEHAAGDKVFVDYSGKKIPIVDRKTGAERPTTLWRNDRMRSSVLDSAGDEIFQISPPNSPEKASRSASDRLFWFRECTGRPTTL